MKSKNPIHLGLLERLVKIGRTMYETRNFEKSGGGLDLFYGNGIPKIDRLHPRSPHILRIICFDFYSYASAKGINLYEFETTKNQKIDSLSIREKEELSEWIPSINNARNDLVHEIQKMYKAARDMFVVKPTPLR